MTGPAAEEMGEEILEFFPEDTRRNIERLGGKPWIQLDPETAQRAIEQVDNLASFLEKRGIMVHRPQEFTEDELAYNAQHTALLMNLYMRDPLFIVGNHIIETNIRIPGRHRENFAYRNMIKQFLEEDRDFRWAAMPKVPGYEWMKSDGPEWDEHPCLAGGDAFVLGPNKVLVGRSGQDTTPAGIKWLERYLSDFGIEVVETIQINPDFLHLDDGLALVDEGLAIVCRDQYTMYGMPKFLDGWDLINVTTYEAKTLLGGNGMILGPKEVVIDARLPHISEQHGLSVAGGSEVLLFAAAALMGKENLEYLFSKLGGWFKNLVKWDQVSPRRYKAGLWLLVIRLS